MKRLFEILAKANQVLFFLTLTGLLSLSVYLFIRETSPPSRAPAVPIVDTKSDLASPTVEDVQFLGEWSNVFVFGIVKHTISRGERVEGLRAISLAGYGGSETGKTIVNVVFSDGTSTTRSLLRNDGLVLHY